MTKTERVASTAAFMQHEAETMYEAALGMRARAREMAEADAARRSRLSETRAKYALPRTARRRFANPS